MASPFAVVGPARGRTPIYIADMHFHLFFFGRAPASTQPLARNMAAGQATLVSWSLVGDVPWLQPIGRGFKQRGTPKPGEALTWFSDEMRRVQAHITQQKLKIARTAEDIDESRGNVGSRSHAQSTLRRHDEAEGHFGRLWLRNKKILL